MSDTRERCVHGWVDPMEWCTSCMAARIAELEAQARERDERVRQLEDALREDIADGENAPGLTSWLVSRKALLIGGTK